MTSLWTPDADLKLTQAIRDELMFPNMINGYILVVDADMMIDGEMEPLVLFNCLPGQRDTQTLGLLRSAVLLEENGIVTKGWNAHGG